MKSHERRLLTREEKMGAILLFVFALITVGLGLLQLRNNIYGPFVIRPDKKVAPLITDAKTRLQNIDTDRDGLNDYEELEFFGTSPYLPDTDSDGVGDKEEVDAGTNPVCVDGESCETAEANPQVPRELIASPLEAPGIDDVLGVAQGVQGTTTVSVDSLLEDPALLRALLVQTGKFTEEDLRAFTDAELLEIAKRILSGGS